MADGLRLALTMLTVAPAGKPAAVDRRTAGRAMELAPVVGLGIGVVCALVLYGFRNLEAGSLLPCLLAIGALALTTRGLHLDGLADLADGLGAARDPEGTRAVMKAPDVGPFGVVTLVLVLAVQATALLACVVQGRGTASLLLAVAVGRLALTAACRSTPAASPSGLGSLVAQTVRPYVTTAWATALAAAFAAYALVDPDAKGSPVTAAVRTVVAVGLSLLAARLLRAHAVRRVGGITGDVLGAICEIATTVCLVALSVTTGSTGTAV